MTSAATIAKALGGHRSGDGYLVRCPLPEHGRGRGDRNPSLLVKDGDEALLVTCFGGCDRRNVLDALRRNALLDDQDEYRSDRERPRPEIGPEPEPNADALAFWRGAVPHDPLLEEYLRRHRKLPCPWPPSLRFAKSALYPPAGHSFAALVAAVSRPDRKIVAVQLTFLRQDGSKAPISSPRWTVGRLGSGAIRLAPAGEILGLAEGVENALSAMHLSGVPCWSTVGCPRLHKITLPDCVCEVHLFADDDHAGHEAAERAADRYSAQGRKVVMRFPPAGAGDWNDYLRSRAKDIAA